jgi:hypothetical protein
MHPAAAKALFEEQSRHLTSELCERRGWILHHLAFPTISLSYTAPSRTPLRMTYTFNDWNDLPPSIRLENPDGTPLHQLTPNPTGIFHVGPHNVTNLPFVCMRGSREYHTHPSHVSDLWAPLRDEGKFDIGGIMTQIWHAWSKGSG